jgi:hypothetical protein
MKCNKEELRPPDVAPRGPRRNAPPPPTRATRTGDPGTTQAATSNRHTDAPRPHVGPQQPLILILIILATEYKCCGFSLCLVL